MRRQWRGFLVAGLLASGPVFGQGGALPKGSDEAAAAPEVPAKDATADKRRTCFFDLMSPPGGNGRFSEGGKVLYLLAQSGGGSGKSRSAGKAGKGKLRYTLQKIDLKSRQSELILALDQRANASLVTIGEPVEAVGAVAFSGHSAGCYEGPATAVTIALAADEEAAVHMSGEFQLVETPEGRRFVDLKKSAIPELDPKTFQTKLGRKFPAGDRPLYFDPAKRQLVTWHNAGEQRGLIAYDGEGPAARVRRLALKRGDRVLQNGGRFAVAHLDVAANVVEIQELDEWTKTTRAGRFKVSVPPVYPVASAGVEVNFDKRIALIYGGSFVAKQRWQRVFVFNYATGELLGAVPVTGTQYLNYAAIDPTGAFAVFEVRDMDTRQTLGAKLFSVAKKSFDDLALALPRAAASKD